MLGLLEPDEELGDRQLVIDEWSPGIWIKPSSLFENREVSPASAETSAPRSWSPQSEGRRFPSGQN